MGRHDVESATGRFLARTDDGEVLVVTGDIEDGRGAGILLLERVDGTRANATPIGRFKDERVPVDATLVAVYTTSVDGIALRDLTDIETGPVSEEHGWGALGLPNGLDTPVHPADAANLSDPEVARRSSGFAALERHPTLGLAPGDELAIGEVHGVITAIDRRAGTLEVEQHDGEIVTLDLDAVGAATREETV